MSPKIRESAVFEMVSHITGVDPSKIKPTSRLDEDLGADSLDRSELALLLEENFGVEFAPDAQENWQTVAEVQQAVADAVQRAVSGLQAVKA